MSTGQFDSTIPENTNSFISISGSSINVDEENFNPTSTSSPIRYARRGSYGKRDTHHPLRILSLNCQSIKAPGKKALLQNMIESTNADIVIGTESWKMKSYLLKSSHKILGTTEKTELALNKEEEYSFW